MMEFYGVPNSAHFWHWPSLFHFAFVALAGGMAFVTMIATLRDHPRKRTYALVTMGLIVLDLFTLWLESPARFRFTHVWLFLTVTPTSPIWIGAWGLILSLVSSFFVWISRGPRLLWGALLIAGSSLALIYPGLALAVNVNRPIWTMILIALFPLTGMVTVVALALLFRQAWAKRWIAPLSLASAFLGAVYLWGLATGAEQAQAGFSYLWSHGGPLFLVGLALLIAPAFLRRLPFLAALVPLVGATVVRSLIVEVGQHQFFGF
jgi:hypothetical protein